MREICTSGSTRGQWIADHIRRPCPTLPAKTVFGSWPFGTLTPNRTMVSQNRTAYNVVRISMP